MEDYRGAAIAVTSQEKACSNNIIADNIITGTDSGTDNASSYGITLSDYCTGNTVTGNIIAKAAKAGIKLEGSASAEKERPFGNRVNGNSVASTASGIVLLNAEDNAITGNDIRGADVGIAIDTSGDGAGAYSRRNYAVYNGLFYCAKTAVKLGSVRCEANGVFGNFGSGNGENVSDQGTGTVTAGF
jgi:nitrous oxidase accessory protein NosD